MTRTLWILAFATLAVQLALLLFGSVIVRALASAGWPLFRLGSTLNLPMDALLILTAGAGVYAAGKAHRGGWVALFAVALVLSLYGLFALEVVVAYTGLARALVTSYRFLGTSYSFLGLLASFLEALVPIVALVYALRYRTRPGTPEMAIADGGAGAHHP